MTFATFQGTHNMLHHFPHALISRFPNICPRKIVACALIGGFLAPLAMRMQPPARAAGLSSYQPTLSDVRDKAAGVPMTAAAGSIPLKPDVMNEEHLKETYGKFPFSV